MYWKCTVCNYIHTGEAPPEKCPVCGADRSKFVEVDADGEPLTEDSRPQEKEETFVNAVTSDNADSGLQRWKCTVCGYIHTGPEPPEKCPVCGADRSLFVPEAPEATVITEPTVETTATTTPRTRPTLYDQVTDLMTRQHAHPISVHIPNGVAPVGVLFLFLAVLFQSSALEISAFCNLVVVLLSMPFVIFSGVNDWKKRFGGNMTYVFRTKFICAGVISVLLLVLVFWRAVDPSIAGAPGGPRTLYLLLHAVLIVAAAVAGYMGGKLVFPHR